jgi:hypothetical protein
LKAETEKRSFTGNDKFKFKTTLHRHNARLKLNYCLLPDSPNFSLLSTFNRLLNVICDQSASPRLRKGGLHDEASDGDAGRPRRFKVFSPRLFVSEQRE